MAGSLERYTTRVKSEMDLDFFFFSISYIFLI